MPTCYLKNCKNTCQNERRSKHEKGDKESNIYHSHTNNDISNGNASNTWIANNSISNRYNKFGRRGTRKYTTNC